MTIEFDVTLTTIMTSLATMTVSVAATWWFSCRHQDRQHRRLTRTDLTLAEIGQQRLDNILGFAFLFGLLVVPMIALFAIPIVMIFFI